LPNWQIFFKLKIPKYIILNFQPMSSFGGRQRKISPCKDREAVYAMVEGWSFQKMNEA
jgi:hypothetical protein